MRDMKGPKVNRLTDYGCDQVGGTSPVEPLRITRISIEMLANGFLVAPQGDYIGMGHDAAHVARDRDELLKLVGEMIDAHAK